MSDFLIAKGVVVGYILRESIFQVLIESGGEKPACAEVSADGKVAKDRVSSKP